MNNLFKKKKTPAYGIDRFADDLKSGSDLEDYGFRKIEGKDGSIRYRWQSFDESMLRNPDNGYLMRVFMNAGSDGKPTDIVVTAETAQYGEDGVFEAHDVQNLSDDEMKDIAVELATDMDYSEPFLESLQERTDRSKESSDEKPVDPEHERDRFANRLGYALRSGKHLDDYGFECSKNLPDGRTVYSLSLVDDDGAFRYANIMTDKYGESMGLAGGRDYPDGTGDHFGEEHLQFVSRSDLMDLANRVMDLFGYTDEDAEFFRSINNQNDNMDSISFRGNLSPDEMYDHWEMMNTVNLNVAKDNENHTYGGSALWNDDHHPGISDEQWDDLCRNGKAEALDEIGNPVTIFDYERDESLMKEDEESYGELLDAGEDIKAESDFLQKGDVMSENKTELQIPSGYIRAEDNMYIPIEENNFSDNCRKYADKYVSSVTKENESVKDTAEETKKSEWTKLYVPENRLHTRHQDDNPAAAFDVVEIPLGRQKVESFTVAHKGDKEFDGKGDPNKDILVTIKSDRPRNVTVYDRKTGEREKMQKMPEELVSNLKAYKSYQKSADAKHKEQAAELSSDVKDPEVSAEDQME